MLDTEDMIGAFERNAKVIQMQTQGLSHEQCLLQLPFRGNCMNWVLGHIAVTRNDVLKVLGEKPVLSEREVARYRHGSEPVLADGEDVAKLKRLLDVLEHSQERIAAALKRLGPEDLAEEVESHLGVTTRAQRLLFLYFHDTYHTAQTELLRQLAGMNDKMI